MRDTRAIIANLPFVKNHGIEVVSADGNGATVRMPFDPQFGTPPDMFPTAMVGMIGDVAAVSACYAVVPEGYACATLDFTVKNTGLAQGDELVAIGRVLMAGKTVSVGAADVYAIRSGERVPCGTVLATGRVYKIKDKA
jgi:acyl-coenzyme A thioesterase PaaI-like protein